MTREELDIYVDAQVTNKTTTNSLTPTNEGNAIKSVADYVDENFVSKNTGIKTYKAIMTQSSTNAPVVNNILGDNSVGSIVWSRVSTGLYYGTLAGAFNNQKTFLSISPLAGVLYEIYQSDSDNIIIKTLDVNTVDFMDGGLNKTSILIEVYP